MNTNFTKENCDQWVEYAYNEWLQWVRTIKPEQYYLRESTRILVRRMRDAIANGSNNEAWNLLAQLKKLGDSIYDMRNDFGGNGFLYEQAEINLECAVAAYLMGDRHEAGALLDVTNGCFIPLSIHKAVTCWISGCIHWQSQTHFDTALVSWEKSLQIVNELARDTAFEETFAEGCAGIAWTMNDAIRKASSTGFPPAAPRNPGPRPTPGTRPGETPPPNPGPSPRPRNPSWKPRYSSSLLRTFPVIGSIPAGAPASIVDDSDEDAIIDGFEINGYYYSIYSLVEEIKVNASWNSKYFILRVNGDSMNNAAPINIEDGDYVLMVKQDTAKTGDIVAAEVENVDREATLKRFFYQGRKPALRAESRNPANDNLSLDKPFSIRGKAIAVLKRDG